jgi:hypothetical protein
VTGTLPTANGGTNLTSFTSGGAVYATSTSALTTGTLPVASGGTARTSYTANSVLFASATNVIASSSNITFDGTNGFAFGASGSTASATSLTLNGTDNSASGSYIIGKRNGTNAWLMGDTASALGTGTGFINYNYGTAPWIWYLQTGAEQMRLNATGLGIGTSTPAAKLDVVGTMFVSGNVGIGTSSPVGRLSVLGTDNTTQAVISGAIGTTGRGLRIATSLITVNNDGAILDAQSATGTPTLIFQTASTEQMRLNSTGLGIGISSPSSKLDVNGTSFLRGDVGIYSSSGGAVPSSLLTFGSAALVNAARINSNTQSSTAGTLSFSTAQTGTGTMTERMVIDASGNVGIGTTSPAVKLQIQAGTVLVETTASNAKAQILLGSAGASYGQIQNDSQGVWSLGYGATYSALGTPVLTWNASGNVKTKTTISVGDATPSTSGAGITFPATQSASSDANTLDDYEEGTFTPVVTASSDAGAGGTYTLQLGYYTKIGNCVSYIIDVSWTAHTGTGNFDLLTGLPFTSKNVSSLFSPAAIVANGITLTALNYPACFVTTNSTGIALRQLSTGGSATATIPFDTAGSFFISGQYFV